MCCMDVAVRLGNTVLACCSWLDTACRLKLREMRKPVTEAQRRREERRQRKHGYFRIVSAATEPGVLFHVAKWGKNILFVLL